MSKLELYRSKALEAVRTHKAAAKGTIHKVEVLGGAYAAGYLDAQYPLGIGGVPASAGAGLLLIGVGMGMQQGDLSHLGLGLLAGFAYEKGSEMGLQQAAK